MTAAASRSTEEAEEPLVIEAYLSRSFDASLLFSYAASSPVYNLIIMVKEKLMRSG